VDKTQFPVFSVYVSSLHRHAKSLSSHDETDSPCVTQVICCRGQLCRRIPRRAGAFGYGTYSAIGKLCELLYQLVGTGHVLRLRRCEHHRREQQAHNRYQTHGNGEWSGVCSGLRAEQPYKEKQRSPWYSEPAFKAPTWWSSVGRLLIDRPKKKVTRALNRHSIQPCFPNKWTGATSFMPYVERSAGRCGILDLSNDKNLIVEPGDWSYWWSYEQTFPLPT